MSFTFPQVVPYLYYPDANEALEFRVHVLVDDLDTHHARAAAAGALIHSDVGVHLGQVRIYVAGDCGGQQWIFAEPVEA